MRRRWASLDAALARVERLKTRGIWPAVIGPDADGYYWLSFDPGDDGSES